jgi:hypothetical protein
MGIFLKTIAIVILIFPIGTFAGDNSNNELIQKVLDNVDISHPYYGKSLFGDTKIDTFKSGKQKLLIFQSRYGGDGEHTPNILKIYKYHSDSFKDASLVFEHNLDSVKFETRNSNLIFIKGLYIETSCFVCDGWEVSDPEGIFKIPIIIDINGFTITTNLNQKERNDLLNRIKKLNGPEDSQQFIDLKERLKYYLTL